MRRAASLLRPALLLRSPLSAPPSALLLRRHARPAAMTSSARWMSDAAAPIEMPDARPDAPLAARPLPQTAYGSWRTVCRAFGAHEDTPAFADSLYVAKAMQPRVMSVLLKWGREHADEVVPVLAAYEQRRDYMPLMRELYQRCVAQEFHTETSNFRVLKENSDMRLPHQWYPLARAIRRRIIYHMGPTNSGKTYQAMQSLLLADRGIYCAPLRLLALEVYEKLNQQGVHCNLVTGQETRETPGAAHLSCTVEMIATTVKSMKLHNVAVLDEIQMIGDTERGWAWTCAFLGMHAYEIHLCGDPSARELITRLCESTGDDLEFREYERRTELSVCPPPANGFKDIEKGDCVVAFRRKDLFALKATVETVTQYRAAIVYGKLPPEVRSEQARLFNEENSSYDVLVATDAIGMGLNLNIRRVIFSSMRKFDGTDQRLLHPSEIRQIAGRAGRAGSRYPDGLVTCMEPMELPVLVEALRTQPEQTEKAGLLPSIEHIETFSRINPNMKLSTLMQYIESLAQIGGNFFLCNASGFSTLADLIEGIKELTAAERYLFCMSPALLNSNFTKRYFVQFAQMYSVAREVQCLLLNERPLVIRSDVDLAKCEERLNVMETYLWLSERLVGFVDKERVVEERLKLIEQMNTALRAHWSLRGRGQLGDERPRDSERTNSRLQRGGQGQPRPRHRSGHRHAGYTEHRPHYRQRKEQREAPTPQLSIRA